MDTVQVKDKTFRVSIPEATILKEVERVAAELTRDMQGQNPLFLCVLNGSFMFAADLMKRVNIPAEIQFVKVSSYQGTASTGQVTEVIGLNTPIEGRTVVIIEDILESGCTLYQLKNQFLQQNPADVRICTLLYKPEMLKVDLQPDYVGMVIPNDFIVGYGLDYDGYGRNLPDIYSLVE